MTWQRQKCCEKHNQGSVIPLTMPYLRILHHNHSLSISICVLMQLVGWGSSSGWIACVFSLGFRSGQCLRCAIMGQGFIL